MKAFTDAYQDTHTVDDVEKVMARIEINYDLSVHALEHYFEVKRKIKSCITNNYLYSDGRHFLTIVKTRKKSEFKVIGYLFGMPWEAVDTWHCFAVYFVGSKDDCIDFFEEAVYQCATLNKGYL